MERKLRDGRVSYSDKLRDPRWQKRRLERLNESEFRCDRCDDDKNELQFHHRWYLKDHEPWDYGIHQLETLCAKCHGRASEVQKELKQLLSQTRIGIQMKIMQLLSGCKSMSAPVAFSCYRQDAEGAHRLARLHRCFGLACVDCITIVFAGPMEMHDHKGDLSIWSERPLSYDERVAFQNAWLECGECPDNVSFGDDS